MLGLIRQWLNAPVVEPAATAKRPPTVGRKGHGTPQGGVLIPLLANISLHWFDRVFHRSDGPAHWAKAKLVRYADDFVVLARRTSPQLQHFVESKLEGWLGRRVNREKTRVMDLRNRGRSLDFLGYTFRYDRNSQKGGRKDWNWLPSKQALIQERAVLHAKLGRHRGHLPVAELIADLNRHLRGWGQYVSLGCACHTRLAFNACVRERLVQHLQRRSQRGWKRPAGESLYDYITRLALKPL